MKLIKITRESVKFELVFSREVNKYELTYLNKQIHTSSHSSDNISLRLLRSVEVNI